MKRSRGFPFTRWVANMGWALGSGGAWETWWNTAPA